MSFWDDMELWQKMLFILAVAMALTLIWGFWKLNWRRIKHKKHLSVDLEKSATEANLTESVLKEEIPFGIRALEAGIEVEGVVVSRPTSPRPIHNRTPSNMTLVDASSSMGSLMNCAHAESSRSSLSPPSPGLVSSFDRQPTTPLRAVYQPNPYAGISGSTINMPSHQSSPATTRAPSAENLPTLAEQSVLSNIPRTRLSSPPLSNNRVSAMIGSHRRSATYGGDRSGQPNLYGPSRSPSPPDASPLPSLSENQVSDSPDSDSSGSNSEDEKRGTSGYKRSSDQSSDEGSKDLSLMNTHRLSHAAEVGQLTRRPPGPARQSTTSVQSFRPSSTPPNGMIYNTPSSPVYPVDSITSQSPDSLDGAETQHPHRRTLSTFQFNQNVELARELFHPQLVAQPRDENPGGAADETPTTNRPASIRSKKSAKKLVKKNRHSQSSSSEVDV